MRLVSDNAPYLRHLRAPQRVSLVLHTLLAVGLVPGFLWLAPDSQWGDPALIASIWALAIVADRHEVKLPTGVSFDAMLALMVVAVATAGPLPALGVLVVPWIVNVVTGREALLRVGALANLGGYGWQAIVAALVLHAGNFSGTDTALGWQLAAGSAIYCVGWAVGPALYAPLWVGRPFRSLCVAFVDMIPAGAAMIVIGAGSAIGVEVIGLPALAAFALVAVLPQSALTLVARSRPVGRLAPGIAVQRYAQALGVQLDLNRAERRELLAVAQQLPKHPLSTDSLTHALRTLGDPSEASCLAGHVAERWDGTGGPAGFAGNAIPRSARIVAVAARWSELTAAGGLTITHREALRALEADAGLAFDPAVVEAAAAVVAEEPITAAVPAPEPRLHRFGVPAPLRRALASAAG